MALNGRSTITHATSRLAWQRYLISLEDANPFLVDVEIVLARLNFWSSKVFSNRTKVFVGDAQRTGDGTYAGSTECITTEQDLSGLLLGPMPALRVISIVRPNSLQPFSISSTGMLCILQKYRVGSSFLDLLLGLRAKSELSEKGCSLWSDLKSLDGNREICYSLKYMEPKAEAELGAQTWTERQIGVCHRFSKNNDDPNVIILLHASQYSTARVRIEKVLQAGELQSTEIAGFLQPHLMVLTSYLDNWRWYLDHVGTSLLKEENKAMTDDLQEEERMTDNTKSPISLAFRFEALQSLRDTEAEITTASTILSSTADLIAHLQNTSSRFFELPDGFTASAMECDRTTQALDNCLLKCRGYVRSIGVLQNRANRLIQLMADGLNHRNQINNAGISKSLYELTYKSVEDNNVVRVVTIITLIYLPTQFVATFFGMNLTEFTQSSIIFTDNWWIFVASAVPLTLVTLGTVFLAMLYEENKRAEKRGPR